MHKVPGFPRTLCEQPPSARFGSRPWFAERWKPVLALLYFLAFLLGRVRLGGHLLRGVRHLRGWCHRRLRGGRHGRLRGRCSCWCGCWCGHRRSGHCWRGGRLCRLGGRLLRRGGAGNHERGRSNDEANAVQAGLRGESDKSVPMKEGVKHEQLVLIAHPSQRV